MPINSSINKIIIDEKYNGKSLYEISKDYNSSNGLKPLLAEVNGDIRELCYKPKTNDEIKFIYYSDVDGSFAYKKTGIFILLCAIYRILNVEAELKYMFDNGYYFQVSNCEVTEKLCEKIDAEFKKIVEEDIVFNILEYERKDAMKLFEERHMEDEKLLFKYTYRTKINLREVNGFIKYINGPLLYSTGVLTKYAIKKHNESVMLLFPDIKDFSTIKEFDVPENMEKVISEYIKWENTSNIKTIGKNNFFIANNNFNHLVITAESLQDKKMGEIADDILTHNRRIVCISGPSCSGKTSFSHRLSYHLAYLGLLSMPIAADNFFHDRDKTPRGADGDYDFECIEAIDIELLNDTMTKLLNGEEVIIPKYDFSLGKKVFDEKYKAKLKDHQLIILEGIHCLNPKLLPSINATDKYEIFIAPLNKYAIDNANLISTLDLRLLRRIARDRRTRGYAAKDTIKRWPKVIEGDDKYIYPCIKYAKAIFNSSTIYEFNVMKTEVMPLLYDIADDEEVGNTARRLIKLLNFVLPGNPESIPNYAIVREFIGNSILDVG